MHERYRSAAEVVAHLHRWHPNLAKGKWRITSPTDYSYQCIAWAASRIDRKMWPHEDHWWFSNCSLVQSANEATVDHFVEGLSMLGYRRCQGRSFEIGYQKLAIYANKQGVTHIARQQLLGRGWLSKLGDWEDIIHSDLEVIAGETEPAAEQYGQVVQILRRSWWAAIRRGCLLRCFWHTLKHWCLRMLKPGWRKSLRNA